MRLTLILAFMATLLPPSARGSDEAYALTSPGHIEVKTLPAAKLLRATTGQDYFAGDNGLFMKLFRYIDKNNIPMTAPVEAQVAPGAMVFYLGQEAAERGDLAPTAQVDFVRRAERQVAAIGVRGSYSRENYDEALGKLRAWLLSHPEAKVIGEPYAVYWNSPFVPFFLKKSEVHLPVQLLSAK